MVPLMSERFKRIIGMRVRAARKLAGMTQEELAAAVKRSTMSISKIERGQQLPDLTTLLAIATAVGSSLSAFVEDMGSHHGKSTRRQKLETQLGQLVQTLSDSQLAIAVEHVEVVARHRKDFGV